MLKNSIYKAVIRSREVMQNKIYDLIELGWKLYVRKVADELLDPENEKMMQLQISLYTRWFR